MSAASTRFSAGHSSLHVISVPHHFIKTLGRINEFMKIQAVNLSKKERRSSSIPTSGFMGLKAQS